MSCSSDWASFITRLGMGRELPAEPLIPPTLNAILPMIHVGLTQGQIVMLLTKKYPSVKATPGLWSGQSGYMEFILDTRYRLSVSAVGSESPTVNDDFIIYIVDTPAKQRIEIKHYRWK
jgi:hypothetical protein